MRKTLIYIARAFISLIFIVAGAGKLMNWQAAVDGVIMTFSHWHMHLEGTWITRDFYELLVSSAPFFLGIAVALEILGGILLFIGFKARIGALLLLLFLIPTTLLFHAFWFKMGEELHSEVGVFLKNLSLIGALLYLVVCPYPEKAKG